MANFIWMRSNMDLYHIGENDKCIITVVNSGNLSSDFYEYAGDFYEAAEEVILYLLNESTNEKNISRLDSWYFPIVYLYRHSLELLLKASVFQTLTVPSEEKEFIGEVRHDLKQSFDKLLETQWLTIDGNQNAEWLSKYLSDISRLDKDSDMFRYPFGNDLRELFVNQTHISLLATYDNMKRAYEIIKGIYESGLFLDRDFKSLSPKLIIEGGYYYQQSVVGYKRSKYSFYPYFSSYIEVGDFLKDTILTQEKSNFFMPMCYLYRNAIELGLKRLIIEDSHFEISEALNKVRKKKHSILGLWNCIESELKKYDNTPDDDTTLADAKIYIQAFRNFDSSSNLFRYPCDKDLVSYFLKPQKFDIENIALCFKELCNFLDSADTMLSNIKDYEYEMAAEMASYFDYYDF